MRLFESRGGPRHCWCIAWRPAPLAVRRGGAEARRAVLEGFVRAGTPIGILGYAAGEPVAWCSVAPRDSYRPLGGPEAREGEIVWSIACFFVKRALRGRGMTAALIRAAVDHARRQGATVVEAYPVDPDAPSYRFMGFLESFAKAGFHEVGRAGTRRHVMRLTLGPAPG